MRVIFILADWQGETLPRHKHNYLCDLCSEGRLKIPCRDWRYQISRTHCPRNGLKSKENVDFDWSCRPKAQESRSPSSTNKRVRRRLEDTTFSLAVSMRWVEVKAHIWDRYTRMPLVFRPDDTGDCLYDKQTCQGPVDVPLCQGSEDALRKSPSP